MADPSPDTLPVALARHQLALEPQHVERLDQYCRALWRWNEQINLTRHVSYDAFVTRDLTDTRELSRFVHDGERLLDVGSGGGVPGIPLAILRPDVHVALCESVAKRARVLTEIVAELRLPTPVHHARAEELLDHQAFDVLTVRAVAPLAKLLRWFEPHWSHIGRLLVIKGPAWVDERGEARHLGLLRNIELRRLHVYRTPGTGAENVLLGLWPKGTPSPYEGVQ